MSGLKLNIDGILKGLTVLDTRAMESSKIYYGEVAGEKMVNYAKSNAKWIDRTGNSRQTIDKKITSSIYSTTIELRGNTPQFKYLELCNEKKYAILWPTIQRFQDEVLKGWAKMIFK